MNLDKLDHIRLGQAILCQALKDVQRGDEEAAHWLTCEPNNMRHAILEAATNLTQDDINRFMKQKPWKERSGTFRKRIQRLSEDL